jgi:hypothetical protein
MWVIVRRTSNDLETAELVKALWIGGKKAGISIRVTRICPGKAEWQANDSFGHKPTLAEKVASQLPSIGEKATKVAQHFGNVRDMALATEKDWLEAKIGVGRIGAGKIVRAICGEYGGGVEGDNPMDTRPTDSLCTWAGCNETADSMWVDKDGRIWCKLCKSHNLDLIAYSTTTRMANINMLKFQKWVLAHGGGEHRWSGGFTEIRIGQLYTKGTTSRLVQRINSGLG